MSVEGFYAGYTQPSGILLNQFQPLRSDVLSHKTALVLHLLGNVAELSTGRRAKIENGFAGLGRKFPHRQERAWVLDIKKSLLKAGQLFEWWMRFQFENQVLRDPIFTHEIIFHILLAPLGEQLPRIGF